MFTQSASTYIRSHADIRRMENAAVKEHGGSVRDVVLASLTEDELDSNVQTYLSLIIVPFMHDKTSMFLTTVMRRNPQALPRTLAAKVTKVFTEEGNVDKALTEAESTITAVVTESKTKGMFGDCSLSIVGSTRFVPTGDPTFADTEDMIKDILHGESKIDAEATEEPIVDEDALAAKRRESEAFHTEVVKMMEQLDKFESAVEFVGDARAVLADTMNGFGTDSPMFVPHMCSGKTTMSTEERRRLSEHTFIAKRALHDAACLITSEPVMPHDGDEEDMGVRKEFKEMHKKYMQGVRNALEVAKATSKPVRHLLYRGESSCRHCKIDFMGVPSMVVQKADHILDVAVQKCLDVVNNGDVVEKKIVAEDFMTDALKRNMVKLMNMYGYSVQRGVVMVPCNITDEDSRTKVGTVSIGDEDADDDTII